MKQILPIIFGLAIGVAASFGFLYNFPLFTPTNPITFISQIVEPKQKQIIGFLPYWLLTNARQDYSPYITTLTYFALRIDGNGNILKLTSPTTEESGWYALESGKADKFLQQAKAEKIPLSLAIDSGNVNGINELLTHPEESAKNLVSDVTPLMEHFGFTDLNLDIEYTQPASQAARTAFTQFVKAVRQDLSQNTTLTLEIASIDAIAQRLIDIKNVGAFANYIVLMAYDFHATDSMVTGPVAPLSGAGTESEYDVTTAVDKSLALIPSQKLILGIPLYGYEWETIGTVPRSAIIPGSGVLASSHRVQSLLTTCQTCVVRADSDAQESYISYFNTDTNSNHIIFFPDKKSTSAKIAFANQKGLGGLALWALGYEGNSILDPLTEYKNGQ